MESTRLQSRPGPDASGIAGARTYCSETVAKALALRRRHMPPSRCAWDLETIRSANRQDRPFGSSSF